MTPGQVLMDTNAYVALLNGDRKVAEILGQSEAVLLSPVVIGELLDGFRGGSRESENRAFFERFREKPRTMPVPITDATAEWYAEVKRILRAKGRPIPTSDLWIAASCMEHGARLLSYDSHFEAIDGLLRFF
ncbi:MAG: type II toxin-antitoxin system VapC family toxin [Treponema sp.]|nr:type II toxin-antitoxin system VapC family toxin [Treponema sp.]